MKSTGTLLNKGFVQKNFKFSKAKIYARNNILKLFKIINVFIFQRFQEKINIEL